MHPVEEMIRCATCPSCGHNILEFHRDKCHWRPASSTAAAKRLRAVSPISMSSLYGPECECAYTHSELLMAWMPLFAAEWADEKFTRLCADPGWREQLPSIGFQATYSQYLAEDR